MKKKKYFYLLLRSTHFPWKNSCGTTTSHFHSTFSVLPRAGSGVVRIDPLRFLARCRTRRLNQALFLLSLFWVCYAVYWGGFLCSVSLHWYVFCHLVVLVNLSLLAKWLARKTPLMKPNRGEGIISTKPRPKRAYGFRFSVLSHCFIVCLSCLPALHTIFHTPMARYSLLVLKVPLNTNKLTN